MKNLLETWMGDVGPIFSRYDNAISSYSIHYVISAAESVTTDAFVTNIITVGKLGNFCQKLQQNNYYDHSARSRLCKFAVVIRNCE